MSKNVVKASPEGQGKPDTDSVFDFLYHDSRRIGSFLSQFDNNGLLTGLSRGESAAKGSKRGWKVGVGADVPILGGAKLDVEREPGETGSETLERSYDPFWANALTFLDVLDERGMIARDLDSASFGQIVMVKGGLSILDLAMFKDAWRLKAIQAAMRSQTEPELPFNGNRQQRRAQGKSGPAKMPDDNEIGLELLTVLPHTVHATLAAGDDRVWATLRDEFMVAPSAELVLTHGTMLPGEWAMLGILSARPDIGETEFQSQMAAIQGNYPAGLFTSGVGMMAQLMAPLIRTALGRPATSYAVTPLLIFRQVA